MSLPPDNHFYKLGFKGALQLPLNSRFNVSLADSHQKSSFDLSPLLDLQQCPMSATNHYKFELH